MALEKIFENQIIELTKMSYGFYQMLADGDEPLTYTAKDGDKNWQVEVFCSGRDENVLYLTFAFDSNWGARFDNGKGQSAQMSVDIDNNWTRN